MNAGKWNPYIAGGLAGLLAVVSVLAGTLLLKSPKYLGTSTTFVRVAGLIEKQFSPETVDNNQYYQKTKIKIDWQMLFVIGIIIGSFGASMMSKTFAWKHVPDLWAERFGKNIPKRALGAFIGGIIAIMGVRLAGGCPSGHGLSGMMQIAVSGLIAMIGFMGAGIPAAHFIYKTRKGGK